MEMTDEQKTGQMTRTSTGTSIGEIQYKKTQRGKIELVTTLVGALALTAVTLAAVWFLLPDDSWAHQLYFERSWIQYANTYFFWVAIVSLSFRWVRHRYEVGACVVIEKELSKPEYRDMNWQNAFVLEDRLTDDEFKKQRQSLVFIRVTRALARLTKTQSTAEMREYVRIRGEIDYEEMESSYAGIRYLTWLIPTLGFVGTVLGISAGISSCGFIVQQAAVNGGEMPDISFALQALGTAFDTTFLALVYSALAVFCTSFQTKVEEQLLERIDHLSIDEVCGKFQEHSTINDGLVRRLLDMEEKLIDNVHGDRAELSRVLREDLPRLLSETLMNSFQAMMSEKENENDELRQEVVNAGGYIIGEIGNARQKVTKTMDQGNKDILTALDKVTKLLAKMVEQAKDSGSKDHKKTTDKKSETSKKEDGRPDETQTELKPDSGAPEGPGNNDTLSEDDIKTEVL